MEKLYKESEDEVYYRGEKIKISRKVFIDPETGERYTTTESDQEWWKDLRRQYLDKHPEELSRISKECIISPGVDGRYIYKATSISPDCNEVGNGNTINDALTDLYVKTGI